MSLTLIADSGIQFHTFKLVINPNERIINSVGFWEHWDDDSGKVTLDYAEYLLDHEAWVSTRELKTQGYVNEDGSISEEVQPYTFSTTTALAPPPPLHSVANP